jgi:predicted aspartyl protease
MGLVYPYGHFPISKPAATLGGRWVRPRPIIPVSVLGPTGLKVETALLDTGADETVFPDDVAKVIGLDLTGTPAGIFAGVGAAPIPLRYAEVALRVAGVGEFREWKALVGFTTARLRHPMLGFAGFLQFFTSTFHGDREQVELAINSLYPGS